MTPNILLIEPDAPLAAALVSDLEASRYQVIHVAQGQAGLHLARHLRPHVVLVASQLPDLTGRQVCQQLQALDSRLPIILLNEVTGICDRVKGFDAGAHDVLVKPFATAELLARVRSRLRRSRWERPDPVLSLADLTLNLDTREVYRCQRLIELTAKEFDLLAFFMAHPHQVLSRRQILDQVWADTVNVTTNVVEVYIRYLRLKLEWPGQPPLIQTIRGVGYALRSPQPSHPVISGQHWSDRPAIQPA